MSIDEIRKVAQAFYNFADNSKVVMHGITNKVTFNSGN